VYVEGLHVYAEVSRVYVEVLHVYVRFARVRGALPPHSAVRLCLTVESSKLTLRLRLGIMRRSLIKETIERRKGGAFPHWVAAKPLMSGESYHLAVRRGTKRARAPAVPVGG
jgi:hypothetical protein